MSVAEISLKCKIGSTPGGLYLHGHDGRDEGSANMAVDLLCRIRPDSGAAAKRVIAKVRGK